MPTLMRRVDRAQLKYGGAICMTCRKPVDSEEIVEGYPGRDTYQRVLYRCHNAEELVTYEFDSVEWDERDSTRAVQRHRHFDPFGHADEGRLVVQVPR